MKWRKIYVEAEQPKKQSLNREKKKKKGGRTQQKLEREFIDGYQETDAAGILGIFE